MKKVLAVVLTIVLILSMSTSVFAKGKIFVDLKEVVSDTPPQFINNRTMVPVRAVAEMLGYDVYWFGENQQVEVCEKGSTVPVIIMNIGSTRAYYTTYSEELGEAVGCEAVLDSPATIINSRTFVPLRFVAEAVKYNVDYSVDTGDVYLFSPAYIERQEGEGKGDDINEDKAQEPGEGIGNVVGLTYDEKVYVLEQTTKSWLDMSDEKKSELVVLIGRWWEDYENIIVEDYDEMIEILDHQMEQYYKNGVDEGVFVTVCDIYKMDTTKYIITE